VSIVHAGAAVATGVALPSARPRPRPGRSVLLGVGVLVLATAAAGPAIYRVDPLEQRLPARLAPPASEKAGRFYPLGTDAHGRDMLARTLAGTQTSLLIGVLSVLSGAGVGVSLGVMAGHVGGRVDRIVTLLVDVQMSMPFLFLALVLSAVLGPGIRNTIVALALTSWIVYARVARAQSLALRQCDYVHAAQALGATARRVMVRHVLPNILNTIIVVGALEVGRMMLAEAALSFLGLGVPPPQASLGRMVAQGQPYIFNAWWFSTIPGLAILGLVLLVVVLGETLRRRLDPRTRT
jgi:peptide/nickel transport system permease protein